MIADDVAKFFKGKNILVTGGTGLIGIPLIKRLEGFGANLRVVTLDKDFPLDEKVEYVRGDLCERNICDRVVKDMSMIFHLAGVKGGIGVGQSRAATFLTKNILMNTQILEAARKVGVERFLYTSSICIYPPAEVFKEEDAWRGFPDPSDKFGGMAKLIGELQIEAYKLQYQSENFLIARPVNTYGPYDTFNSGSALIIPALIHRVFSEENPLTIWGDGSVVRDFIFSEDVADFFILMMAKKALGPFNVGSGQALFVRDIVDLIVKHAEKFLEKKIEVQWDPTKPSGEKFRVADISRAHKELKWLPKTGIDAGIAETVDWYYHHRPYPLKRYDILSEGCDLDG